MATDIGGSRPTAPEPSEVAIEAAGLASKDGRGSVLLKRTVVRMLRAAYAVDASAGPRPAGDPPWVDLETVLRAAEMAWESQEDTVPEEGSALHNVRRWLALRGGSPYGTQERVSMSREELSAEFPDPGLKEVLGVHSLTELADACQRIVNHGEEGTADLWGSSLMTTAAGVFRYLARGGSHQPEEARRNFAAEVTLCQHMHCVAVNGACPVHGGDSCLRQYTPVAWTPDEIAITTAAKLGDALRRASPQEPGKPQ